MSGFIPAHSLLDDEEVQGYALDDADSLEQIRLLLNANKEDVCTISKGDKSVDIKLVPVLQIIGGNNVLHRSLDRGLRVSQ